MHFPTLLYRPYYTFGHILGIKLQRIVAAGNKVGLDKAGTNVCNGDIKMAHPGLLAKAFKIMTLETLRR